LANTYLLEVVTPEKVLLSESVVQTTIPGVDGYLGVLAGHAPLMTEIRPGEINVQLADGRTTSHIVVAGGFVEVTPQRTTILADRAERADEIDLTRAEADLEAARQLHADLSADSKDTKHAEGAIQYAETRIRIGKTGLR
jgi:F-type H+-transporting ATPase subunit epsilon